MEDPYSKEDDMNDVAETKETPDNVKSIYEEKPEEKKEEGKPFLQLSRLHKVEVELAVLKQQMAEQSLQSAKVNVQETVRRIMDENGLSPENIINTQSMVIVPPEGKKLLVEKK